MRAMVNAMSAYLSIHFWVLASKDVSCAGVGNENRPCPDTKEGRSYASTACVAFRSLKRRGF